MSQEKHSTSVLVGETTIHFETGQMARQANGSVVLRAGDTIIFTSACAKDEAEPDINFFPLKVDYQEKFSSVGKTLGGFIKREGRPTEKETLVSRLIDRPIRPMFPEGYYNDVQILSYVFSFDGKQPVEPLAICAASAALVISDIPLVKPIGAVKVGRIDGTFVINPSPEQQTNSTLDLVLAGTEDAILMIEGSCKFLTESEVLEAIEKGHQAIQSICRALAAWQQTVGKEKKLGVLRTIPAELKGEVEKRAKDSIAKALLVPAKQEREVAMLTIKEGLLSALAGVDGPFSAQMVETAFEEFSSEQMRSYILEKGVRPDGRDPKKIRPITIEQHFLPRAHGSSLFTRGETQSLAVCTLGGQNMAQRFENLHGEGTQKFYLQYFFPPYSVGEVGRIGSPGRREVGHGKLAERALLPIIPDNSSFPYTIRLESNITESNGSSSMASVCGGCLALMDAGVPIQRPVSGIAMGLILRGDRYVILSDILGIEDHLGDMDFKVTGDKEGITAFQMDIKVEGITLAIMKDALHQALEGRIHILNEMLKVCPKPKEEMSDYAPRITTLQIKPSKIGAVIGPSGKQIRAIIEETGVDIDIDDSGLISVTSSDKHGVERALEIIRSLTAEIEIGQVYRGKITSIAPFGIFVELLPGKEGLCHISEFAHERINKLEEFVKLGDLVQVKVIDINERGQLKLSRKATLASPAPKE